MSFEIFGFDILLDENLKPYLLEVNHTPSFTTDTPLDYQIKRNLILDTLILINMKWKTKKQYYDQRAQVNPSIKGTTVPKVTKEEIELEREKRLKWENAHLGGFQKIFPAEDENLQKEYLSYIKTAQDQFDEFSGAKICRVVKKEKEQPASTISGRDKKPGLPPHALAKGRLDNKSTRTIQNSENV